jgi:hypothetical protein
MVKPGDVVVVARSDTMSVDDQGSSRFDEDEERYYRYVEDDLDLV